MKENQIRTWRAGFQTLLESLPSREVSIVLIKSLAGDISSMEVVSIEVFKALEKRGLLEFHTADDDKPVRMLLDATDTHMGVRLTAYGAAFAAWLMEPRETPTNLKLPI